MDQSTDPPQSFELRRQADGLVYRFAQTQDGAGLWGYLRHDGPYWIIKHPQLGWIAGRHGSDEVFGRPWDMPLAQQGNAPPEGVWVSRKDDRSYVYDLVYV